MAPADIESASLGLPGPVIDQRCKPTNVNWLVDARELMSELGLRRVREAPLQGADAYIALFSAAAPLPEPSAIKPCPATG